MLMSMRRVAGVLDVAAGAIYHHIPDKQSMLAGLSDRILAEVPEPIGRWREATEAWARGLRAVLLGHRDSAELVTTVRGFHLGTHDTTRHPTTLLATAGLLPAEAAGAASTLLYFVLGHVSEEQARLGWERFHPPVASGVDADDSFEVGLGLLMEGVEARVRRET